MFGSLKMWKKLEKSYGVLLMEGCDLAAVLDWSLTASCVGAVRCQPGGRLRPLVLQNRVSKMEVAKMTKGNEANYEKDYYAPPPKNLGTF